MAGVTKDDVVKFIEDMSVLELSEMVKELEDKFGVSAAAPVAVAAAGAPAAGGAASAEEQTVFEQARRHLPPSVFDIDKWKAAVTAEEWPKVVYVLNRGGRYENFSKAYNGKYLGHTHCGQVNFFAERQPAKIR